jgi:hypothetical protein
LSRLFEHHHQARVMERLFSKDGRYCSAIPCSFLPTLEGLQHIYDRVIVISSSTSTHKTAINLTIQLTLMQRETRNAFHLKTTMNNVQKVHPTRQIPTANPSQPSIHSQDSHSPSTHAAHQY